MRRPPRRWREVRGQAVRAQAVEGPGRAILLASFAGEREMAAEPPRIRRNGGDLSSGRVFVTGGTGFVGDRLVAALLARGRSVRGLARPTSERPAAAERLQWGAGGILDRDSLPRG